MRFNAKNKQESSSTKTSIANILINKERLTPIDVLTIDKNSRLTLTKKVKKIIPLDTDNKIIVYQDTLTKNILLNVQHEGNTVDSWILTKKNENANKNTNNVNKFKEDDIDKNNNYSSSNNNNFNNNMVDFNIYETEKDVESIFDIGNIEVNNPYSTIHRQKTLYNTPILLVDDENDLLSSFNMLLKIEGYRNVKTFSDTKSVLKHLSDRDPLYYKLAITDIRMPDINGIQLYQILKILNPSIKIIFLTALDAVSELASLYTEIKSSDIMKKPIDPDKFIKTVNDKINSIGISTT